MLREITKHINSALESVTPLNSRLVEIAEVAIGKEDSRYPVLMDNNGEGMYLGPDSDYDFLGYHKPVLMQFRTKPSTGYGDQAGDRLNSMQMAFVVFGRRDRLKRSPDEVAMILESTFPEKLKVPPFKDVSISVNNILLDSMRVFAEEFEEIDFFLPPEQFLIKVNYTIESTYLKRCFTTCE